MAEKKLSSYSLVAVGDIATDWTFPILSNTPENFKVSFSVLNGYFVQEGFVKYDNSNNPFTGTISASNLSGTNTGDQTTITGNAGTATALETARTIAGQSFNGTANIEIASTDLSDHTPDYTAEKTNKVAVFDAGDGEEGLDAIYSGPLKQDGTYGLTIANSVKNGNFNNGTTGWTIGGATSAIVSGNLELTATSSIVTATYVISTSYSLTDIWNLNCRMASDTAGLTLKLGTDGSTAGTVTYVANEFSNVDAGTFYEVYGLATIAGNVTGNLLVKIVITSAVVGAKITVSGVRGVQAIDMTTLGIEDYTEADMLAQTEVGYIDGMQNPGDKKLSSLDSLGNIVSSNYRNAGGSLPDGITDYELNGIHYQNVSDKTAVASGTPINTTSFTDAENGGSYVVLQDDGMLMTGTIGGGDTTTGDGDIQYKLAITIVSYTNSTPMVAEAGGSFIWENKFPWKWVQYTSAGIDLTGTGYDSQTISQAFRASSGIVDGQEILDVSNFTDTSNVFTSTDLVDGDWVWIEVEWSDFAIMPETQFIYSQNLTGTVEQLNATVAELGKLTSKQANEIESLKRDNIGVFAYMSTAVDTVMTDIDTWYRLEGVFTNSVINGFTVDANGITLTVEDLVLEAEYMTGGNASGTAIISIAIVKNATFDGNGKLVTGTQLSGSGGLEEVTTLAGASGFGNPRGLWAGMLATGDSISIVLKSSVANETWTPQGGSASIHRFY